MITSTSNSRIKEARKLQRRRTRHEQGLLLLEGVRLVRDVLQAGSRPVEVFYAPDLIEHNPAAQALVDTVVRQGVEPLACTPAVFATLVETVTPQGIAAVVPLPVLALPAVLRFSLVLDGVRDPGNAGTLLRSAEAAGVDCAIFAPETVDPYNDKVVRAAMGAHFRLPLRVCAAWDEVAALLSPDQRLYVADAAAAQSYDAVDWTRPAALIVGGEAVGASAAGRAIAQPLAIPMAGGAESLNAAVAGAVILFEAARQRRLSGRSAGL
ncbi:MAG: RNA methyltransferase [Caldilineaceae bacterium]|nr:RNA methyltransferase [Caldilineaceae bacterium]